MTINGQQQAIEERIARLKATKSALVNAINERSNAIHDTMSEGRRVVDCKEEEIKSLMYVNEIVGSIFSCFREDIRSKMELSADRFDFIVFTIRMALEGQIYHRREWVDKYAAALSHRNEECKRLSDLLKFLETKPFAENPSQGEVS